MRYSKLLKIIVNVLQMNQCNCPDLELTQCEVYNSQRDHRTHLEKIRGGRIHDVTKIHALLASKMLTFAQPTKIAILHATFKAAENYCECTQDESM